jgi:hypothetical protein
MKNGDPSPKEITTMLHSFIKAGAVLAFGSFALAGQALTVSPLPFNDTASLLIPVGDEENEAVWQNLRPNITPPPAAVGNEGETPKGTAMERPKEEGSGGNLENEEVWHNLRPNVTPPPAAVGD